MANASQRHSSLEVIASPVRDTHAFRRTPGTNVSRMRGARLFYTCSLPPSRVSDLGVSSGAKSQQTCFNRRYMLFVYFTICQIIKIISNTPARIRRDPKHWCRTIWFLTGVLWKRPSNWPRTSRRPAPLFSGRLRRVHSFPVGMLTGMRWLCLPGVIATFPSRCPSCLFV